MDATNKPPDLVRPGRTLQTPPAAVREFLPAALALEVRPLPFPARLVLHTICALIAILVVWAAISQVDRIVVGQGRLITTAPQIVVQPLETAILRSLEVQVGDRVSTKTILATLDPTFAAADLADLTNRRNSLDAQITRLGAELDEAADGNLGNTPEEQVQAGILSWRRTEYRARVTALDERAAQLKAMRGTNRLAQKGLAERLAIFDEIEGMRRQLLEKQTGSRLQLLEAQSERLRLRDDLNGLRNRELELGHEFGTVRAERGAFVDEWRRKTAEELVEISRQRASIVEQMAKAERRRSLVSLTAPVDAVVLDIAKRSVGSVIKEAEPLITLVPADVPVEIEAEIEARDIGAVRAGDSVRVKLDAFPFQRHGVLQGEVRTISADAFPREPMPGQPNGNAVFRTRIRLLTTKLDKVPEDTRLGPGLMAAAEIKVGERSVLSYFLYPVIRVLDEGIRDP